VGFLTDRERAAGDGGVEADGELLADFTVRIREGLTCIWPPTEPITWPTRDIPEARLVEQAGFMLTVQDLLALPVHGLTAAEIEEVRAEYLAGADPQELRERWSGNLRHEV